MEMCCCNPLICALGTYGLCNCTQVRPISGAGCCGAAIFLSEITEKEPFKDITDNPRKSITRCVSKARKGMVVGACLSIVGIIATGIFFGMIAEELNIRL